MNRKHVAQQTQRERNCSPSNGTERRTSARIARVGVSALIAGQLMIPGMSLAAEATGQNTVQTNSTATVAAEEAAPAPPASNNATNGTEAPSTPTQASKESAAAPEAQSAPKANPSQTDASQKASAETAASTASNQNEAAATSQTPAPPANNAMPTDAIQTRGVTDVTDNPGGIKINTTVVNHYADCTLNGTFALTQGTGQTIDFAEVPDVDAKCLSEDTVYFKTDGSSHALVETENPSESVVMLHMTPAGTHMQGTLTYTGGNVDPGVSYSLTLQKEKKAASTLTYTGTDYEGGPIITGDPDDIFNGNQQGGSVVINETRDDYYLRYNISTELTLAATQQQSLENLNVNDVKTDYAPGEAPRATGTIPAADADKYEIAYECWEEMDGSDPTELTPVAFWYSDPAKYTQGMKKIDHFEEGKFYMYSVELRLKDDNTLADVYNVNVNGQWASNTIKTINGVFAPNAANMLCEQPIDEWQAIDVIEISGATTTFKAGDRPAFTAGTPTGSNSILQCEFWTGSDGDEVNSVEFWDQNITNHIDAFKPGVTYRYGLYFKPARGFYFTPDTKLMINGVECGYQASELSVVDPESGWIHTLWLNTDLTFTPEAAEPTSDPTPQPGSNAAIDDANKLTQAAVKSDRPAKYDEKALPITSDNTAVAVAALGFAGTAAAAGAAAARRRNH